MEWTIPGTVLTGQREDAAQINEQFRAMFLGGGVVLSQVSGITGLDAYTIQNWVRRVFLSPPQKKRYTLRQLCRILNISMLKDALPMERICSLLGYVNGQLNDESDDIIDDSVLYFMFVTVAARLRDTRTQTEIDSALEQAMAQYQEPVPGARERVELALRIMLTAWLAVRLRQQAEKLLQECVNR